MPSVEFYYLPESPPCRTVEMVANMISVTLNKHYVNLFKAEHLEDEYRKINPRTKVPFMIDGDVKIGESRAIIRYLINKYKPDDDKLYPKDPVKRAYIDEYLDFENGTLMVNAFKLFSPKYKGIVKEWNTEDEKVFKESMQYLDDKISIKGDDSYLLGDNITIADISLAAFLTYPGVFSYDLGDFKNVVNYKKRIDAAIPKFSEINSAPTENLKRIVDSIQSGQSLN